MKTGILGGTFNPIHLAHLRIAEEVQLACDLDRLLFVPAAEPPHKDVADQIFHNFIDFFGVAGVRDKRYDAGTFHD